MWSSAKGSGIRSHKMPGAIAEVSPGAGGATAGNRNGMGLSSIFVKSRLQ
jgi:hypothetical protein